MSVIDVCNRGLYRMAVLSPVSVHAVVSVADVCNDYL